MSTQRGFTLIEMLAAVMIAGFLAILVAERTATEAQKGVLEASARSAGVVAIAAKRFRLDTGMWPSNTSQLVPAYLNPNQATTPDGAGYSFTNVSGDNLRISYDTGSTELARQLAGRLPDGSRSGTTVRFLSSVPGQEPSLTALYPRSGERPLTGDMDADDNSINNVDRISANQLRGRSSSPGIIRPDGDSRVLGDFRADGNLRAGGEVVASLLRSSSNGAQFVDPNGPSRMRDIDMEDLTADQISASTLSTSGQITAGGDIRGSTIWGTRFVDTNNTTYFVNPSSTSRFRSTITSEGLINTAQLRITNNNSEGGFCPSSNAIGLTSSGELLQCSGGRWEKPGGAPNIEITFNRRMSNFSNNFSRQVNLGWHHHCTISGTHQSNSGNAVRDEIILQPDAPDSQGRLNWDFWVRHADASGSWSRVICFTFT